MAYSMLLDEHKHHFLKRRFSVDSDFPTCTLKMPTYFTQCQSSDLDQIYKHICVAITSQGYVVLDFGDTLAIDGKGRRMLKTLFQAAYNFSVGLGFINLSPQMQLGGSLTGLDPIKG